MWLSPFIVRARPCFQDGVFRVPKNGDARNTKPTCYAGGVNLLIAKNHLFITIELFRHYRRKEKVI